MENKPNPATPANSAATPGIGDAGKATPANNASDAKAGADKNSEGTVTIPTKEYAELQRAKARTMSFEKRKEFNARKASSNNSNSADPNDPAAQELERERQGRMAAEQRLLREQVKTGVQNILSKPEYAELPISTKNLILKNPAMLSEADNIDEALLDIEDFVNEQIGLVRGSQPGTGKKTEPVDHETPSNSGAGGPDKVESNNLEDISGLTGSDRSRAIMRNAAKKRALGIK